MNAFRQALEAHLNGQLALTALQRELHESLSRQSHLASAHGAIIEALYRGDRIPGTTYLALIQLIHSFQVSQTQTPAPVVVHTTASGDTMPGAVTSNQPADADKTRLRPHKTAADISAAEPDKTRIRPHPGPRTNPTHSTTTGASIWSDPSRWLTVDATPLVTGSVIKDRFVLEEEIGRGGMGTVFKARDQRKVEALDRSPHVAIKVLNEDFRHHPQSLQALQREARKAQKLAHPNIVTVHDFDRDGANVFMVMELLEGESLDRVIKATNGVGVGVKEALRIARDLCRAMAYAHEQGIVHADFKPANVFRTRKGVVKIFDFGIARAVKRGDHAEGSVTVFDPGTLGALTPAYASCEVIEGKQPDAQDDIYAMGCVIYELLTGQHPFKKMSAAQARDAKLVAEPPPNLPRWQWKALQRALEFRREDRPATAMQFLDELLPLRRTPVVYIGAAAAAVAIVGAMLIVNQVSKYRERSMIEALASAEAAKVEVVLPKLRELAPARRGTILLNESARAGLIRYFEARVDNAVDERQGHYDYSQAQKLVSELMAFFPDSQAVKDISDRLSSRKMDAIKRQSDLLDLYLKRGVLISAQDTPNVTSVLDVVRRIDSNVTLLRDPRLPGAFAEQARLALQRNDIRLAELLVSSGLGFDPRDMALADLRDQVRHASTAARTAREAAVQPVQSLQATQLPPQQPISPTSASPQGENIETLADDALRSQLTDGLNKQRLTIAEARKLNAIIKELARRGDTGAQTAARDLAQHLVNDASALQARKGYDEAIRFAQSASALIPNSPPLKRKLTELRSAAARDAAQRREASIAQAKREIDILLGSSRNDDQWYTNLERQLTQLTSLVPASDAYLTQAKLRAADLYISRATQLREAQRLSEAETMLERARKYGMQSVALVVEEQMLEQARAQQEREARERDRLARIAALKQKLMIQAQANEVAEAQNSLAELRTNLPAKDPFVTREGPKAIGEAYLRMASSAAKDGRFMNAVSLADRGKQVAPFMNEISAGRKRFARYVLIDEHLSKQQSIDVIAIRTYLTSLTRENPEEMAQVSQHLARNFVNRINSTDDARIASRLSRAARQLFGDDPSLRALGEGTSAKADDPTLTASPSPLKD